MTNINVSKDDGLFYISYNDVDVYYHKTNKNDYRKFSDIPHGDEDNYIIDEKLTQNTYDNFIKRFTEIMTKRFKSFKKVNRHTKGKNARHIILVNQYFEVAIEDNDWSFAVELIATKTDKIGLQRNLFKPFYKGICDALLELTNEIFIRKDSWNVESITKNNKEIIDDRILAAKMKIDKKVKATTLYQPAKMRENKKEVNA